MQARHVHRVILSILLPLLPALCVPNVVNASTPTISGNVTGADGAAIAAAVVFVRTPTAAQSTASTPDKLRPMEVVDQVNKTFVPGLRVVVVGTSVRFPNHDQIHHHVYSFSPAKTFELPLYKGEDATPVLFDKVGVIKLGCNIHDWMSGIILVLPTPHFAVTDDSGRFVLENLPKGAYTLVAWHALSKLKPEETAQPVELDGDVPNVNFKLALLPARPRPAVHGVRAEP